MKLGHLYRGVTGTSAVELDTAVVLHETDVVDDSPADAAPVQEVLVAGVMPWLPGQFVPRSALEAAAGRVFAVLKASDVEFVVFDGYVEDQVLVDKLNDDPVHLVVDFDPVADVAGPEAGRPGVTLLYADFTFSHYPVADLSSPTTGTLWDNELAAVASSCRFVALRGLGSVLVIPEPGKPRLWLKWSGDPAGEAGPAHLLAFDLAPVSEVVDLSTLAACGLPDGSLLVTYATASGVTLGFVYAPWKATSPAAYDAGALLIPPRIFASGRISLLSASPNGRYVVAMHGLDATLFDGLEAVGSWTYATPLGQATVAPLSAQWTDDRNLAACFSWAVPSPSASFENTYKLSLGGKRLAILRAWVTPREDESGASSTWRLLAAGTAEGVVGRYTYPENDPLSAVVKLKFDKPEQLGNITGTTINGHALVSNGPGEFYGSKVFWHATSFLQLDGDVFDAHGTITVSTWLRLFTGQTGMRNVWSRTRAGGGFATRLRYDADAQEFIFSVYTVGAASEFAVSSTGAGAIPPGRFHHVVCGYNSVTGNIRLWVDGSLVASDTVTTVAAPNWEVARDLIIGRNTVHNSFLGWLEDFTWTRGDAQPSDVQRITMGFGDVGPLARNFPAGSTGVYVGMSAGFPTVIAPRRVVVSIPDRVVWAFDVFWYDDLAGTYVLKGAFPGPDLLNDLVNEDGAAQVLNVGGYVNGIFGALDVVVAMSSKTSHFVMYWGGNLDGSGGTWQLIARTDDVITALSPCHTGFELFLLAAVRGAASRLYVVRGEDWGATAFATAPYADALAELPVAADTLDAVDVVDAFSNGAASLPIRGLVAREIIPGSGRTDVGSLLVLFALESPAIGTEAETYLGTAMTVSWVLPVAGIEAGDRPLTVEHMQQLDEAGRGGVPAFVPIQWSSSRWFADDAEAPSVLLARVGSRPPLEPGEGGLALLLVPREGTWGVRLIGYLPSPRRPLTGVTEGYGHAFAGLVSASYYVGYAYHVVYLAAKATGARAAFVSSVEAADVGASVSGSLGVILRSSACRLTPSWVEIVTAFDGAAPVDGPPLPASFVRAAMALQWRPPGRPTPAIAALYGSHYAADPADLWLLALTATSWSATATCLRTWVGGPAPRPALIGADGGTPQQVARGSTVAATLYTGTAVPADEVRVVPLPPVDLPGVGRYPILVIDSSGPLGVAVYDSPHGAELTGVPSLAIAWVAPPTLSTRDEASLRVVAFEDKSWLYWTADLSLGSRLFCAPLPGVGAVYLAELPFRTEGRLYVVNNGDHVLLLAGDHGNGDTWVGRHRPGQAEPVLFTKMLTGFLPFPRSNAAAATFDAWSLRGTVALLQPRGDRQDHMDQASPAALIRESHGRGVLELVAIAEAVVVGRQRLDATDSAAWMTGRSRPIGLAQVGPNDLAVAFSWRPEGSFGELPRQAGEPADQTWVRPTGDLPTARLNPTPPEPVAEAAQRLVRGALVLGRLAVGPSALDADAPAFSPAVLPIAGWGLSDETASHGGPAGGFDDNPIPPSDQFHGARAVLTGRGVMIIGWYWNPGGAP